MTERRDKLGRRIPVFDRSMAAKKGERTKKERYGHDFHERIGTDGGRSRTRGYFGNLKDKGKEDELRELSKRASEKSRTRSDEAKREAALKGWEARRAQRAAILRDRETRKKQR